MDNSHANVNNEFMYNMKPKSMEIQAVIRRADGTVEDLGTISYRSSSWWRNWLWKIKKFLVDWSNC